MDLVSAQPRRTSYAAGPSSLNNYRPSAVIFRDAKEHESWKCFQDVLTYDAFAVFESDSLGELILRVSQFEPSVQCSTFALGGLCKIRLQSTGEQEGSAELTTGFWFRQYTKAVGLLANGLSVPQSALQSTLVACILFIWIELLQRQVDAALHHLLSGLKILRSLHHSNLLHTIAPCVRRAFTRLHAQARVHGSPTSVFNREAPDIHADDLGEMPSSFEDVAQAKTFLDIISENSFRCMRQIKLATGYSKVASSRTPHLQAELGKRIEMGKFSLQKWHGRFLDLQKRFPKRINRIEVTAFSSLELQYVGLYIVLQSATGTSEMLFDEHMLLFERILTLTGSILDSSSVSVAQRFFDPRLIPGLFLVAMKCRKVGLRQKAIELLRRAPEQEGMWRRDSALALAIWKLESEHGEGTLSSEDVVPEDMRIRCERSTNETVDGKVVTVRRFVKGDIDFQTPHKWEQTLVQALSDMDDMI